MYLGSALKLAIPLAILDRVDFARVHGFAGADAAEAEKACDDMRAIAKLKVSQFSAAQRETARLALCWAEQYLYGYVDAQAQADKTEADLSRKQMKQIRKVRLDHFGATENEARIARCVTVPIGGIEADEALLRMLRNVVVCSRCNTRTNARVDGDVCNTCKVGTFQQPESRGSV